MKVGIVILNYNDLYTTKDILKKIKNFKSIDYILVVDNNSTDNSYEELKKINFKNYNVIKTDKNKGYAYGNNYGIKFLKDNYNIDLVIISNPDVIFTDETIKELKKDFTKENVSLVAPIVVEHGEFSRGWKVPRYTDDLLSNITYFHKYLKKRLDYENEYYENKKLVKVDAVHGCFFMVKVKDFFDINLFDENTFLYYEENIIGKKFKDKNYGVFIDNELNVIHNLSVSVDKTLNSLNKYKILKESQKYYEKKYNNINFFQMFLLRLFYYISYYISKLKILITSRRQK